MGAAGVPRGRSATLLWIAAPRSRGRSATGSRAASGRWRSLLVGCVPCPCGRRSAPPFDDRRAGAARLQLPGRHRAVSPEYVALLLGLVIYTAAYIAEIVRSGILAVLSGQWEAAGALGLRRGLCCA